MGRGDRPYLTERDRVICGLIQELTEILGAYHGAGDASHEELLRRLRTLYVRCRAFRSGEFIEHR